jgi:hemolysin D
MQTTYREGQMELTAPQAGTVKDIGFIQVGQTAQVKLAAYPFQKYGLLTGKVVHVSADATEVSGQSGGNGSGNGNAGSGSPSSAANPASQVATYKARIALSEQHLISPTGQKLQAGAGMQVAVEIHQGRRTVLEYLLSPVAKAVQEAGREK